MSRGAAWGRAGLVLAAVLVIDQVSKALVRTHVDRGSEDPIFPALKLVHVKNEGVAFGIAAGGKTIVIALISIALIGLVVYFGRHASKPLIWLPTGLLVGGALGNIIDRVHEGAVTDFLKLPAWPAFNVADIAITFGVITLAFVLERSDDESPA